MLEYNSRNAHFLARLGAQGTYGQSIHDMIMDGEELYCVSADLGIASGLDRVIRNCPKRFVNVGIAEQNMVSIAAGIAEKGVPVFASSWAPFATYRCADQIRVFLGMMQKNVKIVGLASGMHIPKFGGSHYGIGDIALMRAIPNITILAPCDGIEIYSALSEAQKSDQPMYIRLTGGDFVPMINDATKYQYKIGKANLIREGDDVLIISCGSILNQVLLAVDRLENIGISCSVLNMHTIKPLDVEALKEMDKYKLIVTVEEHNVIGGLGSAVAEFSASLSIQSPLMRIGIEDFVPVAGDYNFVLQQCGLDYESIYHRIENTLKAR